MRSPPPESFRVSGRVFFPRKNKRQAGETQQFSSPHQNKAIPRRPKSFANPGPSACEPSGKNSARAATQTRKAAANANYDASSETERFALIGSGRRQKPAPNGEPKSPTKRFPPYEPTFSNNPPRCAAPLANPSAPFCRRFAAWRAAHPSDEAVWRRRPGARFRNARSKTAQLLRFFPSATPKDRLKRTGPKIRPGRLSNPGKRRAWPPKQKSQARMGPPGNDFVFFFWGG